MGSYLRQNLDYDAINRLTTLRRDGLLLDARYYDGADRVVLSGIDGSLGKAFFDRSGLAGEQRRNVYDGAGRLYSARVLKMTDAGLSGGYATTYSGYDQAGNVTQYRMDVYDGSPYTNTYTYTHDRFEGYREKTLSGTSTALDPGQTTYQYDVNGNLIGVVDTKDASKNQTLVNDASGKILQRVQNGQTIRSLVVNGELLGTTGPAAGADDFSPSFRPIDGGNPSASPGSYRIQAGDTLQSIAQQAYGDSRLWYLVAEANGLASDRDLRVGATVTIPNRVSGNHNDYKSFKPYDPGKLIGDTQPTMPVPKPDSGGGGGCGGIGMIIVAVVAVVATVFTAGALAPVAAGAATGFGATMAAGAAVLTGASAVSGLAAVGIGLAAGAVGSIVSQGVGMAIGVQSKFSWKGVATSALGAGVTAGVGSALNGANILTAAGGGTATGLSTGSAAMDLALRATVSSTVSQGLAMATGLQSKFSWTNVAAAGIGAGVGSAVGSQLFPNVTNFGERLARGFVSGAVGGVAASVLSGGKANYVQIAVDAFGNALGNSVVEEMGLPGSDLSGPTGTGTGSDDRTREIFRQQTMGDIQRLAAQEGGRGVGQGPISLDETAFNDIGSLRELGRGPKGEIYWNNDVTSYPVADRRMIPAVPLAPLPPVRPADSMREIGALEGFFTFNKVGRFFSGAGTAAKAIPGGLLHAAQQAGYASADVTGYAVGQLHEWAGDSSYRVRPQSNFFMQAQEEGLGLTTAKYGLEMVDSAVGRPLRAFVNGKPEEMGETTAQWLLGGVVGKLVKGGAGMAGDAIVGRPRSAGEIVAGRIEGTLGSHNKTPSLVPDDSKFMTGSVTVPDKALEVTTFYHGTGIKNAVLIRETGIDLSAGRASSDFGRGFYMTTSREEALMSAKRLYGDSVDVVKFSVPNREIESMSSLKFSLPDRDWQDFVRFHKEYQPSILLHGGTRFDMVEGPLFRRYSGENMIHWSERTNQTSIHTDNAVDLFNKYMER